MRPACALPLAILVLAASVRPEDGPRKEKLAAQFDRGNRYAVIIGINEFDDRKALSPLRFCVADAMLLADVLVKRGCYPADNIVLLADGQSKDRLPTRENILARTTEVLKKVKHGDTVLFYIATHGGVVNGQSHVCPKDFDSAHAGLTYISIEWIRDMVQSCDAAQKLVVLDACHSGASTAVSGLTPGLGGDVSKTMLAGGLITFAAASAQQTSKENAAIGHGFFTFHLSEGLGGKADRDADGIVDSDELYSYVLEHVSEDARRLGDPQTPVRIIGGDVVGVFALSRVAGEAYKVPEVKTGQILTNSLGMEFSLVMPGSFEAGSPADEAERDEDENPHRVTIGRPYLIGRHEVTQAQYERVVGTNPSWFSKGGGGAEAVGDADTSSFPVEQVSWDEAMEFCAKLAALPGEKAAGLAYRLPTEMEWEFACRAGTTTAFSVGSLISSLDANVNGARPYLDAPEGPSLRRTTKVGSYPANPWGLFDMHGNVWEWCSDWYAADRGGHEATDVDPRGPSRGDRRVIRGGSYAGDVALCRCASRKDSDPEYRHKGTGFRVVCVPTKK